MESNFRWKKLRSLGEGGQGRTFVVADTTSDLPGEFVLKECKSKDLERQRRFLQEIKAVRRLRHPNVVSVIDSGSSSDLGRPYYVMPLYPNGDLWSFAKAFRTYPIQLLQGFVAICNGVEAAHAAGIVHRDIKPQNILFDASWNPVLIDFGICFDWSEADNRLTATVEWVGPRGFMAPELEGGQLADVEATADIYSLGKVLWYLFAATDPDHTVPREQWRDPRWRIKTSEKPLRALLEEYILRRTVNLRPQFRYSTTRTLRGETERIIALIGTKEHPSTRTGRMTAWFVAVMSVGIGIAASLAAIPFTLFPNYALLPLSAVPLFIVIEQIALIVRQMRTGLVRRLSALETRRSVVTAIALSILVALGAFYVAGPANIYVAVKCNRDGVFSWGTLVGAAEGSCTTDGLTIIWSAQPWTTLRHFKKTLRCENGGKLTLQDEQRPLFQVLRGTRMRCEWPLDTESRESQGSGMTIDL